MQVYILNNGTSSPLSVGPGALTAALYSLGRILEDSSLRKQS